MRRLLIPLIPCLLLIPTVAWPQTIRLDELDLSLMETGWGSSRANRSVDGNPLSIGGRRFHRGIGTHAVSTLLLRLDGEGVRFSAMVGVDDEAGKKASVSFYLLGDGKVLWESGVMKKDDPPRNAEVNVRGVKLLGLLVTDAGDGIDYDHADWCDVAIEMKKKVPLTALIPPVAGAGAKPYILTPKPPAKPRINGARVFAVRPGNPFLYSIAATGRRPMSFGAKDLPEGLSLDPASGRITGSVQTEGTYRAMLTARNAEGTDERELRIVVGGTICLTPPMGWNSWNCWAEAVDDAKVRAAADAMVASGLAQHGWSYINIDDCWMTKPGSTDSLLRGEPRDAYGMMNTNGKFPDMRALSDYVHAKGLKLGIYSSPGPLTCAGYTASHRYEREDARRFADWGIDYLKYDWCSYGKIAKDQSLQELKKPYTVMREALDLVRRDIVYSLCQYGMGKVWEWGAEVGGNCWRTTGDIVDTWSSMAGIGFQQAGHEAYAAPGRWNDPDMLVVGRVGWGPNLHPTRLKPDEQYTHISLWALLSAPLLIGCDLNAIDDFTLNLLTNDEVIAVNQDPLGRQARRISARNGVEIWVKELEDGSKAVGLFHVGRNRMKPEDYFSWSGKSGAVVVITAEELGVRPDSIVRDVWRQKDLGRIAGKFKATIPHHGVILLRIRPVS